MEHLALDHQGEFPDVGSVNEFASNRGQFRHRKLIDVFPRDGADIVRLFHLRSRRDANVYALRSLMHPYVNVALRKEMVTQGGCEQQIPPHAMVIMFGFPCKS